MRRRWFRDRDGTYYRNVPMVLNELDTTWPVRLWKRAMLLSELDHIYREGHTRRRTLGWWQVEVQPMTMREAYPDRPIFWTLDEDR